MNVFKKIQLVVLIICITVVFFGIFVNAQEEIAIDDEINKLEEPKIDMFEVKWAHSPYIDCSTGIIGMENGWFEEVGIKIKDPNAFTPIENTASFLASGSADVVDAGFIQIVPSLNNIPNVRVFTYHDIFQGQSLMGQPTYKSVDEYLEEGLSLEEAIKKAVSQMKGKTILISPDPASQSFATVFLNAGGLELSDVEVIVADYKQHVPLMLAKRADFENGGGPTIIQMLKNNFKPIIETKHIIAGIDPKVDISQLTSIVFNGYVALKEYIENNYPAILRISSVNFRIADFIRNHPKEAAEIQGPFLNRFGGSQLDVDDVVILYTVIDPFFGFYEQKDWYTNEESPYYWKYTVQAFIDLYEEQGIMEKGKWTPENVELTHKIYSDMEKYRAEAEELINKHKDQITKAGGKAKEFLEAAEHHYAIFNFYDANRFVKKAIILAQ